MVRNKWWTALAMAAGVTMLLFSATAADKYWVGGASGDWSDASWADSSGGTGGAWVDGSTAIFESSATIGGVSAFNVGHIENTGTGSVTFTCPVKFSGTYYVVQNGMVSFPGGATATYPDDALRTTSATLNTLTLRGDFTFTADWSVNSAISDSDHPWVVAAGSTVQGQGFTGTQSNTYRILRIEEGATAKFTTVAIGVGRGEVDVDGFLEATVEVKVAAGASLGCDGNIGTVKAPCIRKDAGSSIAYCRVPNLIVGAGGLGPTYKDYYWQFERDCVITATADFNFLGVYSTGNQADWGLHLNGRKITVNVPAGITVTCGVGILSTDGVICKAGAGTLVMTDTDKDGQSGYKKQYTGGTIINEGTVRLAANDQLGSGFVIIASGARLEVASGVTVSNQLIGEGTLYLESAASLTVNSASPCLVGEVELASGASVTVSSSGTSSAPAALLSGVSSADYGRFNIPSGFSFAGGAIVMNDSAAATDYVWNGASGADWATAANWLVGGATPAYAPTSVDTIRFENESPVAVGGSGTLIVAKVVTTTGAQVTFNCPVAFADTYLVENTAVAPCFAAGATATYPDSSLTGKNPASHALKGAITFTENWTIQHQAAGNPFVLTEGSTLTGKVLSGTTYDPTVPDLRIDKDAVATFDSVAVAGKLVFWLNGGRLVATGDITVGGEGSPRDFGYYNKLNPGTVEANGLYKSVTGVGAINLYVTNFVVGAGGFGMYHKDYNFVLCKNVKLTAKDDLTIYQPVDGTSESDWGIEFGYFTFTVDTAEHTVVFDSLTRNTKGRLVKEGEGELIMSGRSKLHTGGTVVKAGTMTVSAPNGIGHGPLTMKSGSTLANTVAVSHQYLLTLESGVTLKPAQNTYVDVSHGTLVLPDVGTVTVDMTDFNFVNGVPNPVLCGVTADNESKFTALVPDGVSGAFSISGGFLYYTPTSGGGAAENLFWNPDGDPRWSIEVDAWTNAAGDRVVFTDYANATVADAGTILLPADVLAYDVSFAAAGDVMLNGAGKLGGPGTLVKAGEGTLTFNSTGGLDSQLIIVSNGVFKVGDSLLGDALGASADSSPIVVADGGTLDVNYNVSTNNSDLARSSVTRDKLVRIAGDGFNGQGAIVNNGEENLHTMSDLVLDADASVGGSKRMDVRGGLSGYARNSASISGTGKTLTVKNTTGFAIVNATVDLGAIVVTNGGVLRMENATYHLDNGVRLIEGGTVDFWGGTYPADVPLTVESGVNMIKNSSGLATFNGPITIAEGAKLTQTGGTIHYGGTISGDFELLGGNMSIGAGVPASGWVVDNENTVGVLLSQSGTFTDANVSVCNFGVGAVPYSTVNATFNDSTFDIESLYMAWNSGDGTHPPSAYLSIGPGTTFTAGKICIGDDGTSSDKTIKSVLSVDGGTVHHTGTDFFIAYNAPNSDFVLNSGTTTVDKATIKIRANNQYLGGYNTARFIQNGGVFNYGGAGFTANFEDNSEDGQIVLKGGEFNASANWSIPNWISTCFKEGDENGWTLNQAEGTTATWTTALQGNGDVALNGAATLVGDKEVQGAVGGKWTVGAGFTAGLQGAASLLGGLALGDGATATVDIATGRNAVFTARDFGDRDINNANSLASRFNKKFGGTTRGTITHDETFLFKHYDQGVRPFGNMNYTAAYAVGQFYVEAGAAGTWSFEGKCDDRVALWIDGECVLITTGDCNTGTGSKNLTAGWHSFRHIATDNAGGFGADNGNAYQTLGYKDGSGTMSNFARFNVENLKMRPAADMGDPNNANTIRWSHYKGTSSTVTGDTFKNQDFAWDFCCITNTLDMIQWKGQDSAYLNYYTVNRYEGWFYVTPENADKEWTFRSQYDDRAALWIDGVDSGLHGDSGNSLTYAVTLSKGWHRFRIQTADFTGAAGPWDTNRSAVSYQVAGGAEIQFSDSTLEFSVCPDGYIQGEVTLASNATLSNTASGAAVVYGDVTGTGTGATMSGGFKFEGGKLAFANVAPSTADLGFVLAFSNTAENYLADVGAIVVNYAAKPTRGKVKVCSAGGLTAETAAAKISVAVNGEPVSGINVVLESGNIFIELPVGMAFMIR